MIYREKQYSDTLCHFNEKHDRLGNQFASKKSGKTYVVNRNRLKNPTGFGIDGSIKALFRQKRYWGR